MHTACTSGCLGSFVSFVSPIGLFCFSLQLSERARERKVPVTRIGRLANFGGEVVMYPVLPLLYCPALFIL